MVKPPRDCEYGDQFVQKVLTATLVIPGWGRRESCKFHFNRTGACGQEVMFRFCHLNKGEPCHTVCVFPFHITRPTLKKTEGGAPPCLNTLCKPANSRGRNGRDDFADSTAQWVHCRKAFLCRS